MIVDYLAFQPEFAEELLSMWETVSGETRDAGYFAARRTECAFTDGELIGCALFDVTEGHAWCRLAVREDSRGCGVGRRLLKNLCARVRKTGLFSVLVWGIPKGDRCGAALLKSEGFRRVGRIEGEPCTELYQKLL